MLVLVGAVFIGLGLLSGTLLLLGALGIAAGGGSVNGWLFPAFSILGPTVFMFSADGRRAAAVCAGTGGGLILLGLAALVGGFLAGNGLLTVNAGAAWVPWYVGAVGLLLGGGAFGLVGLLKRRGPPASVETPLD